MKDDGLAAGKGVVVTDGRDEALAHGAACEPGRRRGVPRRPRGVAVRGHRRHAPRCRCSRPRTSSASATATPAPTPAAWARIRRCLGPGRPGRARSWRPWSQPTLAEMRRPRHPVLRRAVRRPRADRRGAEGHRVQLPLRRPGDPGRAGPARDAAGRGAARRGGRQLAEDPPLAWRAGAGGRAWSWPARATRSRPARATSSPAPSGVPGVIHAGTARRADGALVTGRRPGPDLHRGRRHPGRGPRGRVPRSSTASRSTARSTAPTSPSPRIKDQVLIPSKSRQPRAVRPPFSR